MYSMEVANREKFMFSSIQSAGEADIWYVDTTTAMSKIERELDFYITGDAQRSAFRIKWAEKGERMSKHYFNMEKRNFSTRNYVYRGKIRILC